MTIASNYRGFTKHLISTLKQLDGKSLYLRDGNRCPGYGARFECKNTVDDVDTETVMTQMNSHRSVSSVGTNIPPAAAHVPHVSTSPLASGCLSLSIYVSLSPCV